MAKKALFWGVCTLALLYGILIVVNVIDVSRKPSDEEQIRAAVEEIKAASIANQPGGVLEYISKSFVLPEGIGTPESPFNSDRDQVARFLRNAKVETLQMDIKSIDVQQATAYANVNTVGTISYEPFFSSQEFNFPEMQIEFRKESRKRLFLVPDPTWSVVRVHGISADGVMQ